MTGTIDQIRAAIAAIEAGAPDAEINRLCALAFGWTYGIRREFPPCLESQCIDLAEWTRGSDGEIRGDAPNYCASLDAIIAEMPDDYVYAVRPMLCDDDTPGKFYHYGYQAAIWNKGADARQIAETTKDDPRFETPPRAMLLALLRVMKAQNAGS